LTIDDEDIDNDDDDNDDDDSVPGPGKRDVDLCPPAWNAFLELVVRIGCESL
jgi:hypothetical protein